MVCVQRWVRGKFFNYTIINVYALYNERSDDEKDSFYRKLEKAFDETRTTTSRLSLDLNAQVRQEKSFKPTIG